MAQENREYPLMPNAEVSFIGENTTKAIHRVQSFTQKYMPGLVKNATKFEAMYNDLIAEPMMESCSASANTSQEKMEIPAESDEEGKSDTEIMQEEPQLSVSYAIIINCKSKIFRSMRNIY